MARRFAKVSEEEIEEAFFYPSDLVNTKTSCIIYIAYMILKINSFTASPLFLP